MIKFRTALVLSVLFVLCLAGCRDDDLEVCKLNVALQVNELSFHSIMLEQAGHTAEAELEREILQRRAIRVLQENQPVCASYSSEQLLAPRVAN